MLKGNIIYNTKMQKDLLGTVTMGSGGELRLVSKKQTMVVQYSSVTCDYCTPQLYRQ